MYRTDPERFLLYSSFPRGQPSELVSLALFYSDLINILLDGHKMVPVRVLMTTDES